MRTPATSVLAHHDTKRVDEAADRELDADRRFFTNHSGRSHRVREAYPAELASLRAAYGSSWPFGDRFVHVSVRQIRPGLRVRAFFASKVKLVIEDTEEACRALHERVGASEAERRVGLAIAKAGAE